MRPSVQIITNARGYNVIAVQFALVKLSLF